MNGPGAQPERTLDEFLDGLVEGAEREQFERRLVADDAVVAETRLQSEIDRSLKRVFGDIPSSVGVLPSAPAGRIGRSSRWGFVAVAAAVVLLTLAGVYGVLLLGGSRPDRLGPIYQHEIAGGFVPEEVCTSEEQFAGWLQKNYGEALYPAKADGVELVGWSYGVGVTNYSGVLLARVEGTPVVVVVDKATEEASRLRKPEDARLHSFRRTVGGLVLYEVTPLDYPRVLPTILESPGKAR